MKILRGSAMSIPYFRIITPTTQVVILTDITEMMLPFFPGLGHPLRIYIILKKYIYFYIQKKWKAKLTSTKN